MIWPAHLWNEPRWVSEDNAKCWKPSCLTWTRTRYGYRAVCSRHAEEQGAIERAAEATKAVAR